MEANQKTLLGRIIAAIVGLFHNVESVVDDIAIVANDFGNAVKKLESSQIVQFLETEIEDLFPQFKGAIDAVKIWFPQAAAKLANVQGTVAADEAKIQAFLDHLNNLKDDPTLYAGSINTLVADLQQLIAGIENVTTLTPQMSIAAAQVVHDETLGTSA